MMKYVLEHDDALLWLQEQGMASRELAAIRRACDAGADLRIEIFEGDTLPSFLRSRMNRGGDKPQGP